MPGAMDCFPNSLHFSQSKSDREKHMINILFIWTAMFYHVKSWLIWVCWWFLKCFSSCSFSFWSFCVLPSTLWKCMRKRSINVVNAAIHMALNGTWKGMQRIVARPSNARVAVPMPVGLRYSPTSTELAMRSLQSTGKEKKWWPKSQ